MQTCVPPMSSGLQGAIAVLLLILPVAAGVASGSGSSAQSLDLPFEVGEPFPEIDLPTLDGGEPTTLAAYRGDKIILHVFASW